MAKELITNAENTWCTGCGNFGILNAVPKAVKKLEEEGIGKDKIVITAGIGCHGKIHDYLALSGLYSIHGRGSAVGQGMKIANPDLKVIAFGGDGDSYGEGIAHMIFAAKRNADITVLIHDNGAYSLTTGQASPTSERGFKGPSSPEGSAEDPLNPLALMLISGATFVARGYSAKLDNLVELIVRGVMHEGFSIIDILQPSVVFNDAYDEYNEKTEILESPAESVDEAIALTRERERLPIGVFYEKQKEPHHKALLGDFNPVADKFSREKRLEAIREIIGG